MCACVVWLETALVGACHVDGSEALTAEAADELEVTGHRGDPATIFFYRVPKGILGWYLPLAERV